MDTCFWFDDKRSRVTSSAESTKCMAMVARTGQNDIWECVINVDSIVLACNIYVGWDAELDDGTGGRRGASSSQSRRCQNPEAVS